MKPFNLDAAKRGDAIQTRDGENAKFIAHAPEAKAYKVVVLLNGEFETYTEDGTHCEGRKTGYDLFMTPKKRTVWLNLNSYNCIAFQFDSKEEADIAHGTRIGNRAWPLEIEE